jgi:hypothetical protein
MTEKLIVEIDSDLKYRAKVYAAQGKKTLRELVTEALMIVLCDEVKKEKEKSKL